MKKVYIAGPYTKPDPCINTHNAIMVGEQVWSAGMVPFVPHLTHFWHTIKPHPTKTGLTTTCTGSAPATQCCDSPVRVPVRIRRRRKQLGWAFRSSAPSVT